MFNQFVDAAVTCSWTCHENAHNSDLGTDFRFGVGTPIRAPFNGTLRNIVRRESPNLYIAEIFSDEHPNVGAEYMHLSKFAKPGHYLEKQVIGYSGGAKGAVGSGHATGPHIHANGIVNRHLVPFNSLFSEFASVGPVIPIVNPAWEADMKLIHVAASGKTPETFDLVTDYDHIEVTHPVASIVAFITGPGIEVKTPANRGLILATIDQFKKLQPAAAGSVDLTSLVADVQAISDASDKKVIGSIPTTFAAK